MPRYHELPDLFYKNFSTTEEVALVEMIGILSTGLAGGCM